MLKHPANKYHLKELHQEIDYLDRKIAYAETLEKFASDIDREVAIKKLRLKRDPLAQAAMELADKGVEWEAKDLPRSFVAQQASEQPSATTPNDRAVPDPQ